MHIKRAWLTPHEIFFASMVGLLRQAENLDAGRVDAHACGDDQMAGNWKHLLGAWGECVLAKLKGEFWAGSMGRLRAGDVGVGEARAVAERRHHLLLHREDKPDSRYYLIYVHLPMGEVRGWVYGREGMREEYWRELPGQPGRPCFVVPHTILRPFMEARHAR